jgi:two-component system, chemotaxis family, chemotaxis protein CheY
MSKTILVIDDDKLIREGLSAMLKGAGQTVLEAADGKEGLEVTKKEHPDLIVTDLRMPNMSGQEMIDAIRDDGDIKGTPVVILTNDETSDSVNQALQSGVTVYLAKNLDPESLTQQILQAAGA